jgi:hypothetical protein
MEEGDCLPAKILGVGHGKTFVDAVIDWKRNWEKQHPDLNFENYHGTLRIGRNGVSLWGIQLVETEDEATENGKYQLEP